MKSNLSFLAILLAVANAAPAPEVVTVYQTATQVYNTDGSLYTNIDPEVSVTSVVTEYYTPAATTAASVAPAATTAATTKSSGGWLNSLLGWLGDYGDSTTTTAAVPAATTTSPVASQLVAVQSVHSYTPSTITSSAVSSSTATSSGSISGVKDASFAKDILDAHNVKRALHSAPALTWNNAAYQYAQAYADKYDCSGVLTHSHGPYGENLAAGFATGSAALQAWYDEIDTYSYTAGNIYNHFTQVVWKSTTSVGCAYKDCSAQGWQKYVICSYDPAGNVVGQEIANVLPN